MSRAIMTVGIQNARSINTGNGVWNTMIREETLEEQIIGFFESKPWCNNVVSISNFVMKSHGVITVDVEYNQS